MSAVRLQLPSFRSASAILAVGIIVTSVLNVAALKFFSVGLHLVGGQVLLGALWQPVSWLLVETSPTGVLFGALALWSVGGSLERQWGKAGFLRYALGLTFVSGLLTVAISGLSLTVASFPFGGGSVMATSIWVSYGLLIGARQTNFFGFPLSGYLLAGLGGGMTVLSAVFYGWQVVLPSLVGMALVLVMWKLGTPSDWWLRFQSARLSRDLKRRSRHLSSVSGQDTDSRGSDKYLQ